MSSVGSCSNPSSVATQAVGVRGTHRPNPAKMADELFSKLDTSGQGYIQKSDLQAAVDKTSASSKPPTSSSEKSGMDALFSQLDSDGDKKVTKQEFSDGLAKLAQQYNKRGMQDGAGMGGNGAPQVGGAPPPPPLNNNNNHSGPVSGAGSSGSNISKIITSLDKADTNGDGKVSSGEKVAFEQTSQSTYSSSNTSKGISANTDISANPAHSHARVTSQIARLMHAYSIGKESNSTKTLFATA